MAWQDRELLKQQRDQIKEAILKTISEICDMKTWEHIDTDAIRFYANRLIDLADDLDLIEEEIAKSIGG